MKFPFQLSKFYPRSWDLERKERSIKLMGNQTSLALVSLLLWAECCLLFPQSSPIWWMLLALALPALLGRLGWARNFQLKGWVALLIVLGACLILGWRFGPRMSTFATGEWLRLSDRLRQQGTVAVFPRQIWPGRPQRLFLRYPDDSIPQARWKAEVTPLTVTDLGHGLGYIDIDEAPSSPELLLNGQEFVLETVPNRSAPGFLHSEPSVGLAVTVSIDTDECIIADRSGLVRRFACLDTPLSAVVLPDRRLAVVSASLPALKVYAESGQVLQSVTIEGLGTGLTVSPDGTHLAVMWQSVESAGVDVFTTKDWKRQGSVRLPQSCELATFGRSNDELILASRPHRRLLRLRRQGQWELDSKRLQLPRPATTLTRGPDGSRVYLTATTNDLTLDDPKGNHFISESLHTLDLATWSWVGVRSLESRTAQQDSAGDIDSGCGPTDLHLDTDGKLLIAFSGTHEVGSEPIGEGVPRRTKLSGNELFAPRSLVSLGHGVYLASYPAQGLLAFLKTTVKGNDWIVAAKVWLGPQDEVARENDFQEWMRRQGEIGFYEAARAGIACQSCHTQGDSDYARHDIGGEELWGTLSCMGTRGTSPYLRNGGYSNLAALHSTSETLYRDFQREAPVDRREAVAAFMESLPLPLNPNQLLSVDIQRLQRGNSIFQKAQCAECHTYPAFTNLALVPSKSLFPERENPELLDVPSLRGVWRSAPYLHDNLAHTLQDVILDENRQNRHGHTADLSDAEIDDLVYFLESL